MDSYLVVGDTIQHGKQYIDRLIPEWDEQTVNCYRINGLEFRFTTIEQLKNGSLRGKKKFSYALCSKKINLGDFHTFVKPIVKKDKFTVF